MGAGGTGVGTADVRGGSPAGANRLARPQVGWTTAAGRAVFLLALFASVAMRGAVGPVTLLGTLVLFGTGLILGALTPPVEARGRRSVRLCVVVALALAFYLVAQSWSFAGNPFANPLWARVDHLLASKIETVSVAPAATLGAIFVLVAPFVVYAAGLMLFQRDEGGLALMRWLTGLGAGFALFGILQLAFFPDRLLFSAKSSYLDSLTGFFVNRNTAGTLLGVASLAALTLLVCPGTGRGRSAAALDVFGDWSASAGDKLAALTKLLGLFVIVLALFLTRSRGALLATVVAYVTAFGLHRSARSRARMRGVAAPPRAPARLPRALVATLGAAVAILLVVGLFGELAIHRMATQGIDDVRLCVYASTLKAIGENWRFGTGFGTFEFVFPIYRDPDCGAFGSIFLRAHNVYLEGALGLGAAFAPLLLGGLAHVVGNLWRGVRRRRRMRPAAAIGLGGVALVALHSLVDFSLQIPGMAAYFAAYLAAATTLSLGQASKAQSPR